MWTPQSYSKQGYTSILQAVVAQVKSFQMRCARTQNICQICTAVLSQFALVQSGEFAKTTDSVFVFFMKTFIVINSKQVI